MKGLILKDMYYLRTKLATYIVVMIASVVIGVLFSLSLQYGNLSTGTLIAETQYEEEWTEEDEMFYKIMVGGITFLGILLPLGIGYDGVSCFFADEKANFKDVAGTMPVSTSQIVLARYISVFGALLLGYFSSLLVALLISPLVTAFTLGELISGATLFAALIAVMLGSSCCMFYMWRQKEAEIVLTGVLLAVGVLSVFLLIKYGEAFEEYFLLFVKKLEMIVENGLPLIVTGTLLFISLCYFLSVFIAKHRGRKGGAR